MRKVNRRGANFALLLFILSFILSSILPVTAKATSAFDDLVKPVEVLEVAAVFEDATIIAPESYINYLNDHCSSTGVNSYLDAVDRGTNYAVLQSYPQTAWPSKEVILLWQNNTQGDYDGTFSDNSSTDYFSQKLSFSATGGATASMMHLYDDGTGIQCSYLQNYSAPINISMLEVDTSTSPEQVYANTQPYISTFNIFSYPTGYEGVDIEDGSTDNDADGLSLAQELQQRTSDNKIDSDEDGLSDLIESSSNPYYNKMFCNQASPYACADPHPASKDLYIEVDWMDDGVNAAYKPSSAQLGLIEDMLDNKGIHVHFDLGEYGGGNQLPVYSSNINWYETSGQLDIHDFKYGGSETDTGLTAYTLPAQFDYVFREGVWRYLIYGVEEITDVEAMLGSNEVGGGAEPAGDDMVVASQNYDAYDTHVLSVDRAKAGVLAHEIGHLLCLTPSRPVIDSRTFTELNEDCIFDGVDAWGETSNYLSLMNSAYALPSVNQLATMDYSDGTHGTGDHDDWDAILGGGMEAFMFSGSYDDPSSFMSLPSKNSGTKKKIEKNKQSKSKKDITSFITSKAQKRAKKDNKVHELSPWLKNS